MQLTSWLWVDPTSTLLKCGLVFVWVFKWDRTSKQVHWMNKTHIVRHHRNYNDQACSQQASFYTQWWFNKARQRRKLIVCAARSSRYYYPASMVSKIKRWLLVIELSHRKLEITFNMIHTDIHRWWLNGVLRVHFLILLWSPSFH